MADVFACLVLFITDRKSVLVANHEDWYARDAEKLLHADSSATTANLEKILSKAQQEKLTVYSSIYNLTTGEVYVYNQAGFSRRMKFDLLKELKKERHTISIPSLFE